MSIALLLWMLGCRMPDEATPPPPPAPDRWAYATVAELGAAMASGEVTSRELVSAGLERARRLDDLGAVITVAPDALDVAEALDRERVEKGPRGPLHGVPVLVKDNVDVAGLPTTAGSLALKDHVPAVDAPAIVGIRAAGAVIVGKANLSEWANIRSNRSTSGWSALGGQARNPWDRERSPCGSSSGSAVAVAAGIVPLAVGTETDGSIVCPAAVTGIVGIKPTVGVVSQAGIVPISHSQDTAGPMARSVADAALLLAAMAEGTEAPVVDAPANPARLRGARIGVVRSLAGYHPGTDALFDAAIAEMRAHGADVVDPIALPEPDGDAELEVLLVELKEDLAGYLAGVEGAHGMRTLDDVIAFNVAHAAEEMPIFGQELFELAATKGPSTDPAFVARREALQQTARAALEGAGVDALIAPTTGPAWKIDPVLGDHYVGGSSTPAAVAGAAAITVPMGQVGGLPVGITLFGPRGSDATLITLAAAFEAATRHGDLHPEL